MSTDAPLSLPDDPALLKALLLRERQQRAQSAAVTAHLEQTVQSQQKKIDQQQHEIARLLRRLYGPKQERIDPDQLLLFDGDDLTALAAELAQEPEVAGTSTGKSRQKGHGRRELPQHLPREQRRYELSEEDRRCPGCGDVRCEIGQETSEQLEYIPASFKVIEHIRVKYACRRCQEHVELAAKAPQPIEKGLPGPGLLAQVVLSKYGDHTPLYRQEDIFSRHGITLRRSTLCDWIAAASDLAEPLYERMCALVRQSKVIHTDDTTVPLLDPLLGHARQARFWAYIGDSSHPYSVYDFTESRRRDGPAEWLKGFEGFLQADAYGGYDGLYVDPARKIVEVACWAHTRRYWWEAKETDPARAHQALGFIARLYQVETAAKDRPSAERCALRREHAAPILAEFGVWLEREAPAVLPKSPIGEAFKYTQNQWLALNRYVEDGDLSIDNNVSERTVKIVALGRTNWMFVASPRGGRRAAVLLSLVSSAKANQVEPWAWLRDVFTRLPQTPADQLDDLLPDRWLVAHPEHRWRIDDLRRAERASKAH
jgi:transposase